MTKHFDTDPLRFFIQLNGAEDTIDQDPKKDLLADQAALIEELGGEEATQKAQQRDEVTNWLKFNLLSKKILSLEASGKADQVC